MTDVATAPADPASRVLQQLAEYIAEAAPTAILCLGCVGERVQAAQLGAPFEDWPPVHFANLIVNGIGQCLRHVQFTDRPAVPGQTASGLYVPGQRG